MPRPPRPASGRWFRCRKASDIALDESRGKLYIANFTANRIDVLSTSDNTVHSSINSPTCRARWRCRRTPVTCWSPITPTQRDHEHRDEQQLRRDVNNGAITLIDLTANTQQNFRTRQSPAGGGFLLSARRQQALVVTTTAIYTLRPGGRHAAAAHASFANLAQTPCRSPQANLPRPGGGDGLTTSADHMHVWGIASATQIRRRRSSSSSSTRPPASWRPMAGSPRRPAAAGERGLRRLLGDDRLDGFRAGACASRREFHGPLAVSEPVASTNITGHAIDSTNNIVYAQIPDPTQPTGPPYTAANPPTLSIMDADNLTVRDKLILPESMTGRAVLNAAATMLYAVSDSGVMVLPVGSLNQYHRLAASTEDLFVQSSFCTRNSIQQTFTITDPGNNNTDFTISGFAARRHGFADLRHHARHHHRDRRSRGSGEHLRARWPCPSPSPPRSAVNLRPPVRLLISSPDQDQRGAVVDVPGNLTDILAGSVAQPVLRGAPGQERSAGVRRRQQHPDHGPAHRHHPHAMSLNGQPNQPADRQHRFATADQIQPGFAQSSRPIMLPASHYGRSVAQSNNAILALIEDDSTTDCVGPHGRSHAVPCAMDRIDTDLRVRLQPAGPGRLHQRRHAYSRRPACWRPLPARSQILAASPNGNVMLYNAQADTFRGVAPGCESAFRRVCRHRDAGAFVVGNKRFDASLVPAGTMDTSMGNTMGFAFTGQGHGGISRHRHRRFRLRA